MNFNSIITKISIGFGLSLFFFLGAFLSFLDYQKKENIKPMLSKYETISHYLFENKLSRDDSIRYIESFNFKTVKNHHEILDEAREREHHRGFELLNYKHRFYFHVLTPHFRILFIDENRYEKSYYGYILFAFLLMLFIVTYIWIIRSLLPLKNLKNEIQKFANGDVDINCKSDKKDEIADVANEFDKAVKKIALLLDSRQLFLRTIMHELKTPIAKGRIVSELIDEEKQKNRMIVIFEKLNHLIDDFARTEQIVSNNYELNIYRCSVDKIINNSIDMLMLDNQENIILENISNKILYVDIELLTLGVKNLIDNALKYSNNTKVIIRGFDDRLEIISYGMMLEKPLEEYCKPFHNDTKSKNHGMGLGLYIVYSILKIHNMDFEYRFEENQNIFSIIY